MLMMTLETAREGSQLQQTELIVFSDLDGTLLDHDSYSFAPAQGALEALRQRDIPLVLASSKTLDELLALRQQLGNRDPFIVENGGALCIPSGYFAGFHGDCRRDGYEIERFSPDYEALTATLEAIRCEHGFIFCGFHDWTEAQVVKFTGLSPQAASQAKRRLCSEPILWRDSQEGLHKFKHLLAQRGLKTVQGGRFLHVLGSADKALAMQRLVALYCDHGRTKPHTVALGDSPNDLQMLQAADTAVVVKNHLGQHLRHAALARAVYTQGVGPVGWNEAIAGLLAAHRG